MGIMKRYGHISRDSCVKHQPWPGTWQDLSISLFLVRTGMYEREDNPSAMGITCQLTEQSPLGANRTDSWPERALFGGLESSKSRHIWIQVSAYISFHHEMCDSPFWTNIITLSCLSLNEDMETHSSVPQERQPHANFWYSRRLEQDLVGAANILISPTWKVYNYRRLKGAPRESLWPSLSSAN